jgi:hypothetical protein
MYCICSVLGFRLKLRRYWKARMELTRWKISRNCSTRSRYGFIVSYYYNYSRLSTTLALNIMKSRIVVSKKVETVYTTHVHVLVIIMNKNIQVLEETMRVYMPIPQLRRCLARDEKVGEYDVPQGSNVYVSS